MKIKEHHRKNMQYKNMCNLYYGNFYRKVTAIFSKGTNYWLDPALLRLLGTHKYILRNLFFTVSYQNSAKKGNIGPGVILLHKTIQTFASYPI